MTETWRSTTADTTAGTSSIPLPSPEWLAENSARSTSETPSGARIRGTVTSTRGERLRGIRIDVVDADGTVIGKAVTKRKGKGKFVVKDVPAAAVRIRATDKSEDFAEAWLGGSNGEEASVLELEADETHTVRIALQPVADIDVSVRARRNEVRIRVDVTPRGSDKAAKGMVRIDTEQESIELPLVDGRTSLTLLDVTQDQLEAGAEISYLGSKHVAPTSLTTSLR